MTYVIDIDDTLLVSIKVKCECCGRITYTNPYPIQKEIDKSNKLFDEGNTIILWTGRGWDIYDITKQQLKELGIKHHELCMGKTQGIYVDKDAKLNLEDV